MAERGAFENNVIYNTRHNFHRNDDSNISSDERTGRRTYKLALSCWHAFSAWIWSVVFKIDHFTDENNSTDFWHDQRCNFAPESHVWKADPGLQMIAWKDGTLAAQFFCESFHSSIVHMPDENVRTSQQFLTVSQQKLFGLQTSLHG